MLSLCVAAALFIAQTYLAALLVPGRTEFAGDTATNDAFYTVSVLVGGAAFKLIAAASMAFSAGLAIGALILVGLSLKGRGGGAHARHVAISTRRLGRLRAWRRSLS
jgi:hypothetical protein